MRTYQLTPMIMLLTLCLSACNGQQEPIAAEVDPRTIVIAPPSVPDDTETKLYTIRGMTGLIDRGDELMVMVYGHGAREAALRAENRASAQSNLARWLASGKGDQTALNGRLLRVPDLDDEAADRFYYFRRDAKGQWEFQAICTGARDDDPAWPSTCDLTYDTGEKVVSVRIPEPVFLRNPDALAERVLSTLAADGVIPQGKGARVN